MFPDNVYLDEERLRQVLNNLLDNALKFTGQGGNIELKVEMGSSNVESGKYNIFIHVKDSGVGMTQKSVNLFKPYVRMNDLMTIAKV